MTDPEPFVQHWQSKAAGGITSVAISPDGRQIVAGSLAKVVYCLDETGKEQWQAPVSNQAWRIGLSDDGETVVVGTGSTRFWDMRGRGLFCFNRDGSVRWQQDLAASVWGLALSADGRTVAVGTSEKQLLVFDGQGHQLWQQDVRGIGWYAWVWSTAVSAAGELIVAGAADKRMRLLERSGKLLTEFQARGDVFAVGVAADGTVVAAGDNKGYLYLLDEHGRLLWEEQLSDTIWQAQPNADGSRLLVGAGEKEAHIRVYDKHGRLLWRRFVGGSVGCLDISANGRRIAVGTRKGDIYVFDDAGEIYHTAQAQTNVRDVALSYSGEMIVAGSEDGFVYGFRLPPTKTEVLTAEDDEISKLKADEPDVTAVPVSSTQLKPKLTFGKQLRYYRRGSKDDEQGGSLTQKQLADLLAEEGFIYSDAMISNWELDKIKIPHTGRPLLLALIRIFQRYKSIQNRSDADEFLFVGGYRHLDDEENDQLFGQE